MYNYQINKQTFNNTQLFCSEMFYGENVIDDTAVHCHDSFEIIYLHHGEIEVELENIKYDLKSGDLLLIKPLELHLIRNKNNIHLVIIYFKPEFISYGKNRSFFLKLDFLSGENTKQIYKLKKAIDDDIIYSIFNLHKEYVSKKFTSALMIKADILNLLSWITRNSKELTYGSDATSSHSRQNKIKSVINYVNQNYRENISLQEMSELFNISYTYLSKEFKRLTHMNFNTYLNKIRTDNSKFLLKTTTLTIAEISQRVGYSGQSYYTEQFTLLNNISPLKFRDQFK